MKIVLKIVMAIIPYGIIALCQYCRKKRAKKAVIGENRFIWAMTKNERELFAKYASGAKIYLEFGSGGSTIAALTGSGGKVYSVESDKGWIGSLRQKYEIIAKSEQSGRLCLIHADIGKTGKWGVPVTLPNETNRDRFLNYSQMPFEKYGEAKLADVVLIDGRFRVACCLQALLETNENTIIILHDYWNRPQYHTLNKYVEIIDGTDSMMICKRKRAIPEDEIRNEYDRYKHNYE